MFSTVEYYFARAARLAVDEMYTVDEVAEMLGSLESVVRAEIESELIFTAHTNVLLVSQILQQAQTQHASIGVDVFKLEDRSPLRTCCIVLYAFLHCVPKK